MLGQAGVPEATVETFHQGVLYRFTGLNKVEYGSCSVAPHEYGLRGEFGTVITNPCFGWQLFLAQSIEKTSQSLTGDRRVHDLTDTLASKIINQVQHSEAPTAGQLIRYQIDWPVLIRSPGQGHRKTRML